MDFKDMRVGGIYYAEYSTTKVLFRVSGVSDYESRPYSVKAEALASNLDSDGLNKWTFTDWSSGEFKFMLPFTLLCAVGLEDMPLYVNLPYKTSLFMEVMNGDA
jgi:hypothetical protein